MEVAVVVVVRVVTVVSVVVVSVAVVVVAVVVVVVVLVVEVVERRVRLRADLIYDDTLTHQCRCGAGHLTEEEFSTLKESLLKGGLDPVRILAGRRC